MSARPIDGYELWTLNRLPSIDEVERMTALPYEVPGWARGEPLAMRETGVPCQRCWRVRTFHSSAVCRSCRHITAED